jgi:hypothetical protein
VHGQSLTFALASPDNSSDFETTFNQLRLPRQHIQDDVYALYTLVVMALNTASA